MFARIFAGSGIAMNLASQSRSVLPEAAVKPRSGSGSGAGARRNEREPAEREQE